MDGLLKSHKRTLLIPKFMCLFVIVKSTDFSLCKLFKICDLIVPVAVIAVIEISHQFLNLQSVDSRKGR